MWLIDTACPLLVNRSALDGVNVPSVGMFGSSAHPLFGELDARSARSATTRATNGMSVGTPEALKHVTLSTVWSVPGCTRRCSGQFRLSTASRSRRRSSDRRRLPETGRCTGPESARRVRR
jgi:hypothetical protein